MSNWKNVNNWHWVSKNCLNWTQKYFEEQLVGLEAEKNESKVKVTKVDECTGDVELSNRKGKIITIYDVQLKLSWEGTTADGTDATGKVLVPEVAHDTEADEYVFEISVDDDNNDKQPLREVIRKALTPSLVKKFEAFSGDLIKKHGSDVHIEKDQLGAAAAAAAANNASETVTKTRTSINNSSSSQKPATAAATGGASAKGSSSTKVNTTTLEEVVEFQTSAHELYETLLDTPRVSIWTRGPAKISKEKGSKFELFNGNVRGELLETEPDKKIVQSWRLQSWPEGHYSTVTMTLDQKSDCVQLHVKQTGVPIGEEELTQRNWTGYYWRSIKQAFGMGAVF
ncbi:activator of Hsp90 ATPase [Zychaea mexicana]|uniref:activator of Hsp90 ATPase n=1 Tax=Zychaea mexicana TaxID=64656 RepID=UPI0022FED71B|nr:activator of Hsp90 ATPase [Zychaea mexicana]KAI9495615.1 activator of Hsp90 ATPase [Zychaea mexicana]